MMRTKLKRISVIVVNMDMTKDWILVICGLGLTIPICLVAESVVGINNMVRRINIIIL